MADARRFLRSIAALGLTAAGALAIALAGMLTRAGGRPAPPAPPRPRVVVPRPRKSVIVPVGGAVAFDVAAYRFVKGGEA